MSTLESLSFPKRGYCTASAGKMSSTAHDGKWAIKRQNVKKTKTLCSSFRPIKSYWHGAGQVWGVSDHTSVSPPGSCDEWRSVSAQRSASASTLISLSSQVRLQPRSGPRHQTRWPDPVCPRPPQVTSWGHGDMSVSDEQYMCQGPLQQGADCHLCGDPLLRGRTQGPQQAEEVSWHWGGPAGAVLLEWIQSHYVRSRQRYHQLRDFVSVWCSVDQSAGITCSQNIRNIKNKLLCRSFLSNLVQMLNFLLNLFETKYHFNITKSSNIKQIIFCGLSHKRKLLSCQFPMFLWSTNYFLATWQGVRKSGEWACQYFKQSFC